MALAHKYWGSSQLVIRMRLLWSKNHRKIKRQWLSRFFRTKRGSRFVKPLTLKKRHHSSGKYLRLFLASKASKKLLLRLSTMRLPLSAMRPNTRTNVISKRFRSPLKPLNSPCSNFQSQNFYLHFTGRKQEKNLAPNQSSIWLSSSLKTKSRFNKPPRRFKNVIK